jgi:hypothetical protein
MLVSYIHTFMNHRCCLLAGESRSELLQLTKVVAQLPQLNTLCGGNTDLLVDTDEPLDALARTLAGRFQSLQVKLLKLLYFFFKYRAY